MSSELDALPVVMGLTVLALGRAVLTLEDGSQVTMNTEQDRVCAAGLTPFYVAHWPAGGEGRAYAVPDHLRATVYTALNLYRSEGSPPRLTLIGIEQQPDTVTLHALNGEGEDVALTMPRPLDTRFGFPLPRYAGVPVRLSVSPHPLETLEGAQQAFHFAVYPETPQGQAVLDTLGCKAPTDPGGPEDGEAVGSVKN